MSKLAEEVLASVNRIFPHHLVTSEYFVKYKGINLFFDFFIRELNIVIECQGEQHFKFVKYFHTTRDKFLAQKKRDTLKVDYCLENNLSLVLFFDKKDVIKDDLVKNRIYEALDE